MRFPTRADRLDLSHFMLSGLVGYWPLAWKPVQNFAVGAPDANYATGAAVISKLGRCMDFNGSSQRAEISNYAGINMTGTGLTISLWISPDDLSAGDHQTLARKADSTDKFIVRIPAGSSSIQFYLQTSTGSSNITASSVLTQGMWSHVVCVYNGTLMGIYVDGVLRNSTGKTGTLESDTTVLTFAGRENNTRWFNGKMQNVKILDRELLAAEVLYDRLNPWWPFVAVDNRRVLLASAAQSVGAPGGASIDVDLGTLNFTDLAQTVSWNRTISGTLETLNLTNISATAQFTYPIAAASETLNLTDISPLVDIQVIVDLGSLVITGIASSVTSPAGFQPDVEVLSLTGNTATHSLSITSGAAASLELTDIAATVRFFYDIDSTTASLVLTGVSSEVTSTAIAFIQRTGIRIPSLRLGL